MASRSNAILPEPLKQVLELRKTTTAKCRSEVEIALAKYGLIRQQGQQTSAHPTNTTNNAGNLGSARGSVGNGGFLRQPTTSMRGAPAHSPASENSRFTNLGQCAAPEGWRSRIPTPVPPSSSSRNDEWVSVSTNKKRYGRNGGSNHGNHGNGGSYYGAGASASASNGASYGTSTSASNGASYGTSTSVSNGASTSVSNGASTSTSTSTSASPGGSTQPPATAWKSSRFQPLEETIATESMEDRIMLKVRGKVNKLGHSTYDATKAFMQQILDSGETDFLEEFMRFVFTKAATEMAFCGLYARFLHELADEFPHLREVMVRKFREYTRVFDEASRAPDVGTSDYKAFVEAQEQKKFRRGYSQFVAELAKLGEVSMEDFRLLVGQVVETIRICHIAEENRLMCEEVIDCFRTMVQAVSVDWMREYVESLRSIANASRETSPGLTNKGRFAIMDILDLVAKQRR